MAVGSRANWSDITDLYSSLNVQRRRFYFPDVSAGTSQQGSLYRPTPFSSLKSFMSELRSHRWVRNAGYNVDSLVVPSAGELIKYATLSSWQSKVTELSGICTFDAGNFSFDSFSCIDWESNTDCFGFSSNTDCFGFTSNTDCHGFSSNSCNSWHSNSCVSHNSDVSWYGNTPPEFMG